MTADILDKPTIMTFELLPTIDIMLDLYQKPRNFDRFNQYLNILLDEKGEVTLPVSGFNPMAREHAIQKLTELKELNAEKIIAETIKEVHTRFASHPNQNIFKISLNLLDDMKGGWTNRYTSDYHSKFKLNAYVTRGFCITIFWTSEQYTEDLIKERTMQSALRTIYWLTNPKPKILKDHIDQEKYVSMHIGREACKKQTIDFTTTDRFYKQHRDSDNYHILFNFLYGDAASKSLEFPCFAALEKMAGYEYANFLNDEPETTVARSAATLEIP